MNQVRRAHLAMIGTTLIFGLHYTIAKSLISDYLSPMQVIFLRLLGGMVLFWLTQRFFLPEKVERRDLLRLALCGILGFALNQTLFYEGLDLTTPVDASIIHVLNPILVLIFAGLLISERITGLKLAGILLGASGALILIAFGQKLSFSGSSFRGNLLVFLNMIFYALYLVLIKPLVAKYHTTTVMKWVSFFGFAVVLPFSFGPALKIPFATVGWFGWAALAFVILFATYMAYFFLNYALKRVSPTVVSYYTYLQPVIASATSVSVGSGKITWVKVLAAVLIFSGVFLVTRQKQPAPSEKVPEG